MLKIYAWAGLFEATQHVVEDEWAFSVLNAIPVTSLRKELSVLHALEEEDIFLSLSPRSLCALYCVASISSTKEASN
jgi:hypothetical protein